MIVTKICTKCGNPKEEELFYRRSTGRLHSWCKNCTKSLSIGRPVTEDRKKYSKSWAMDNVAKRREYVRKYKLNNVERVRLEDKEYKRLLRQEKQGYHLVQQAKTRAKKKNMDFDLPRDIFIPDVCPVLGIPLFRREISQGPNSPSLDRIDSAKGYTLYNTQVISYKANTMKSDATPEELLKFADWIYATYAKALPDTNA